MRKAGPFTDRQIRWLNALTDKLKDIDDPDPPILTHESYVYSLRYVSQYKRRLPRITFTPYGRDTRIKAHIMRKASLGMDDEWKKELSDLREKHGFKKGRDKEDRILARRFNAYWNRYWDRKAKALDELEDSQKRFSRQDEVVVEPIRLLMEDKIPQLNLGQPEIRKNRQLKPYDHELAELE